MELKTVRKTELKKITNQSPGFNTQGNLGGFFDLFLVCEATARKLIHYYKKDTSKVETNTYTISEIKAALNLFDISYLSDDNFIDHIFKSGNGSRGQKTCRQLRNDYIHTLNQEDRTEIESRIKDLTEYMKKWIPIIISL